MPPPRLDGKVVLITGSAGGIGAAAARRLAQAAHGRIDVLLNTAGVFLAKPL